MDQVLEFPWLRHDFLGENNTNGMSLLVDETSTCLPCEGPAIQMRFEMAGVIYFLGILLQERFLRLGL